MAVRHLATSIFITALATAPCHAQTSTEEKSYITAFACGTLAEPISVEVVTFDDTRQVMAVRRQLLALLTARAISVDAAAPLRLSLAIERDAQKGITRRGDMVEITREERRRNESDLHEDTETHTRLNIWSNKRDSLIGGRKSTVLRPATSELRLIMAIHDKTDGRCLWRGEAVQTLDGRDPWDEAERIVPVLVAAIGETRSRAPLSLD